MRLPFAPTTRWQGRTIGSGFRFITVPDRPRRAGSADLRGESAVCRRVAVLDSVQLLEDTPVELRRRAEVELEVERVPAAGEVLVELAAHAVERLRGAQDTRAEEPREQLELRLRLRVEADAAEPALRDADEQRPDRRVVENVVGHVEVARRGGSRAEAVVEDGGDCGHRCSFSFRSRRTPAEAAWRAACSFEPSAAPIAS